MTYEEFIVKLSETPRCWHLTNLGMIRYEDKECPIFKILYGSSLEFADLNERTGIIYAADNHSRCDSKIREDLLTACGLK